jgi:hypothetical protein
MHVSDADRRAIWQVIDEQLGAFRKGQGEQAFSLASPGIRAMFGTADVFMEMVRSGYPFLYQPRRFSFGEVVALEGQLAQQMQLCGPHGETVHALFLMERQEDGSWRVNGCVPIVHGMLTAEGMLAGVAR